MLSRRKAMLTALAASTLPMERLGAQTAPAAPQGSASSPTTVLQVKRRTIDVNGKSASVLGVSQPDGTPGLVTKVGQQFHVRLENQLDVPTLIHWHGMTPPWQQDGVPGIAGPPVAPGGTAEYDFPLRFGGTFWMHSHQGLQEQEQLAAPLIIHDDRDRTGQQEVVVLLSDFSFTPAEQIFESLRKAGPMAGMGPGPSQAATKRSAMAGMNMPLAAAKPAASTMGTMAGMNMPPAATKPAASAMGGMAAGGKAAPPDLNDAFLANDRTLADPEVVSVEPGGTVLLRVINGSSMSAYHLSLGALNGELIAVDGFRVKQVIGRRFPITVAQRLDIRINIPRKPAAHPILAILEGERSQTGVILKAEGAPVSRVPDTAAAASPALTLDLERSLRATQPLTPRKVDRVHQVDLTGEMVGYVWSINGVPWTKDVPPLPVSKGERVELVFQNRTLMPHPMHLHGHEFQVVEINC